MLKRENVVIKKSIINGKGVFANRDFKKGEIVIKWRTCVSFKPPEKYVNHSCNANTYVKDGCDIALRNIKKGEEITANYIKEKMHNLKMKCNCGSENCKKFVSTGDS